MGQSTEVLKGMVGVQARRMPTKDSPRWHLFIYFAVMSGKVKSFLTVPVKEGFLPTPPRVLCHCHYHFSTGLEVIA